MKHVIEINKFVKDNLLIIFLVLVLIIESYSKILNQTTGNNSDIPKIIKGIILVYMVIMFVWQHFNSKYLKYILILGCFFLVGQFSIKEGLLRENILVFIKYVFSIFLFVFFIKFPIQNKNKLYRVFEGIIIVNSILILIGFIFTVPFFKTYLGSRFGYNGLLYSSPLSSYTYVISLFYFLIKYQIHFFSNWKTILVLISAFFIGTKTIYIALLFTMILYLINYATFKYKYFVAFAMIILSATIGYLMFYKWGIFNDIRQTKGIFSSILSFRNDIFLEDTLPYIRENWTFVNYCFGGVLDYKTKSEMGFIDVFYFFGFIGGILYLYAYCKSFIVFPISKIVWFFLCFVCVIIFVTGNYFIYTTIPLFLLVLREKLMAVNQSECSN